eukprot:scaffold11230_cov109-Cylindrotheca_fusiformis.AAC.2
MMTSGAASRCPTPVQGKGGTNLHILRNKRNTTTTTTTTREFAVIMLFFLIAASMVITSTEASSLFGCVDDDEPPGRPGSEYTCGPSTLSNGVKCDCREEDGQQWCNDSIDNYFFLDDNKTFFLYSLGKPSVEEKEFLTVVGPLTYYFYRMCDGLFARTTEDKANEPGTNYTKVVGYRYDFDCDYTNFKEACDMEPSEAVLQFDRNCLLVAYRVALIGGRDPDPRNFCQPDLELSASPTTSMTVLQAPSVAPSGGGGDGPSTTTSSAQPTITTTSIPVQQAPSVAPSDEGSASGGSSSSPTTSSTSPQEQQPPSTTVQEEEEGEDDDDSSGSWSRPGLWCLLLLLLLLFGLVHL